MAPTPRAVGRKTPWFHTDTPPVRSGIYETRWCGRVTFRRFIVGDGWFFTSENGGRCNVFPDYRQDGDLDPAPAWRGLTKEAR